MPLAPGTSCKVWNRDPAANSGPYRTYTIKPIQAFLRKNINIYKVFQGYVSRRNYCRLFIKLFWYYCLYQYISDFQDSKCIKKALKRAFECILDHQNPICIDIDGGTKTIR